MRFLPFLLFLCLLLTACGGGGKSATIRMKDMRYVAQEVQAQAGKSVTLRVFNEDGYAHAFDVDGLDIHVQLEAKERREFIIPSLAPGRYPFYCSTPGHQMAGMEGVLVVEP
ncbi:MAG: cupredoxin domain-containing protein [Caldilineaceae bacterium]|nr:cupredoxin domain-containing protein [Caldilineaceae bacterium]HRJ42200.1 cupredoxin domain-containing protein [Caldilineaceae bacterium]